MPIPVINYAAIQPDTSSQVDFLGSLSKGLQLGFMPSTLSEALNSQRLANQLSQLRNQYLPQQLEYGLDRDRLANALSQVELNYAPEMTEQSLRARQLTNALSELENQYAPGRLKNAQIAGELANKIGQLQYEQMPTELDLKNYKAKIEADKLARAGQYESYGKLLSGLKVLPESQKADYLQKNAEGFTRMFDFLGRQMLSDINQDLTLSPEQIENLSEQGKIKVSPTDYSSGDRRQLPLTSNQINSLEQSNAQMFPEINQPFTSTPEDVERQRRAAQLSALNAVNPTSNQQQMMGAIQLKHYLENPEFVKKSNLAADYNHILRKTPQALGSFLRINPDAKMAHDSFIHHDIPLILNRVSQLEGMGVSDKSRQELKDMVEKTMLSFATNPERFKEHRDNLINALDRVAKSVESSFNPFGYPSLLGNKEPEMKVVGMSNLNRPYTPFIRG